MKKKLLCISPHTDDIELGAGGFISRYSEKYELFYLTFCRYPHPDSGIQRDTYYKEANLSLNQLKFKQDKEHRIFYEYEIRTLIDNRQAILQEMINVRDVINPNIVICPSTCDTHQDHQAVVQETKRCFKKRCTILGYELSWNHFQFTNDMYIELEEEHIKNKARSLSCYKSQENKVYLKEDFQRSLASIRGVQSGCKYAECFEVIRIYDGL